MNSKNKHAMRTSIHWPLAQGSLVSGIKIFKVNLPCDRQIVNTWLNWLLKVRDIADRSQDKSTIWKDVEIKGLKVVFCQKRGNKILTNQSHDWLYLPAIFFEHAICDVFDFNTHLTLMKDIRSKRQYLILSFLSRVLPWNLFYVDSKLPESAPVLI